VALRKARCYSMQRIGATSYYHADGLGSVTSLSSSAGAIAQTYTFDSFGKQTASTGSLVNPFRFEVRKTKPLSGCLTISGRLVLGSFFANLVLAVNSFH
jgi:hypothetical protein